MRSHRDYQASVWRENAQPVQAPSFRLAVPGLPTIADKPVQRVARGRRIAQEAQYPRVARIIGSGGQCVSYAKSRGFNISGNANQWPVNARLAGYRVDKQPAVGAIIVTRESSAGTSTGHVTGPIEKIEGGYALIKEQNYVGGKVTEGWISLANPNIVNFIHQS